jgi:thiosulfate reductase/polysulfide reductase chain A
LDKPARDKGKQIGTILGGKPIRGFFTPSGKCELYNADFAKKKDTNGVPVDPVAVYKSREWMPDENFPLYLINWKEASHTHTRTQNNAWLLEIKATNPLVIARLTAERLGIADGDEVWVESKYAKSKAMAMVTDRIHSEVVGAQHGFGHWAMGKLAKGKGSAMGDLNHISYDPLSGQATHKEICVKVYKA